MKRKSICICLVLSMLWAGLAGCGTKETGETRKETTSVATVLEETVETGIPDNLPEMDYDGTTFTILTEAEQWQKYYISEETNGDVINDAVYDRNSTIEERFNLKLYYDVFNGYGAGMEPVKTALQGSVLGGSADYDLMVGGVAYVFPRIADSLFVDMKTLDYIDFSKPWWHQYNNKTLEVCNKQYLASGSFGMLSLGWAVVTFFNKNVQAEHNLEDIYALVNDGKWTFDKYAEMAYTVTYDMNGDGLYDKNDRIGVTTTDDYFAEMSISFGYHHISKDEDGKPVVNGVTERILDINDKLYALTQSDSYIWNQDEKDSTQYSGMISLFVNDQSIFMTHRLNHVENELMRDMENYGIVPNPKYDESQEDYITPSLHEVSAIPAVVKDFDMSAILVEALNAETYRSVIPAYYEIALQRKLTRDEESAKMLDIITSHLDCDFAYMTLLLVGGDLFLKTGFEPNYVSWMEKNQKSFQTKYDQFVKTLTE